MTLCLSFAMTGSSDTCHKYVNLGKWIFDILTSAHIAQPFLQALAVTTSSCDPKSLAKVFLSQLLMFLMSTGFSPDVPKTRDCLSSGFLGKNCLSDCSKCAYLSVKQKARNNEFQKTERRQEKGSSYKKIIHKESSRQEKVSSNTK